MTRIFDGMAGALNSIFGAPVKVFRVNGGLSQVEAIFREKPIEVVQEDQSVAAAAVSLRVLRNDANLLGRGDRVDPGNGSLYLIVNQVPSGSPADDAFIIFELEEELS